MPADETVAYDGSACPEVFTIFTLILSILRDVYNVGWHRLLESASHGYAAGGITGLEYVYAAGFDV